MMKRSPPRPLPVGSIRPMVALAAIAASMALPPRSRICTPARAASGWLAATMPCVVATTERPTTGRCERPASWLFCSTPPRTARVAGAPVCWAPTPASDSTRKAKVTRRTCMGPSAADYTPRRRPGARNTAPNSERSELLRLCDRLPVQVEELDVCEPGKLILDLGVVADDRHDRIFGPEQHLRTGLDRFRRRLRDLPLRSEERR